MWLRSVAVLLNGEWVKKTELLKEGMVLNISQRNFKTANKREELPARLHMVTKMDRKGVTPVGIEFAGLAAPRLARSQNTNGPRARDMSEGKTSHRIGANGAPPRIEAEFKIVIGK